jgi:serine/threonine protein kinase
MSVVVVKTLYAEMLGRDIAEVFREGRLLKGLRHPAIIEVTRAGYADTVNKQRPYLVMEYFEGVSLENYLERNGPLSLEQALALAHLVAQALKAAHDQGVLHRDLKPNNLLVRREGNGAWAVKLIDFGLAARSRVVRESVAAGSAGHSLMGTSLGGTYQYSAPEQLGLVAGGGPLVRYLRL